MLEPRLQVLFNPGPVNLHPSIKQNLFNVELCHREPEFERLAAASAPDSSPPSTSEPRTSN